MILPWQQSQWQQLWQARERGRLPHALLLLGMPGIGKVLFAEIFIRGEYCQKKEKMGESFFSHENCSCHPCCLIRARVHPNVLWIEPDKPGGIIKIDQVREVTEFVQQTSSQGEYRFVILHPANRMNINSANALLKTLEEPSSGAIIVLISDQTSPLPATILSRCQTIHFPKPPTELALTWLNQQTCTQKFDTDLLLKLASGAPLTALQFTQTEILTCRSNLMKILFELAQGKANPIQSATQVSSMELMPFLDLTLTWIIDLLKLKLNVDENEIMNKDFISQLMILKLSLSIKNVVRCMNKLQQLRNQILLGINLNKQLVIETLFISLSELAYVFS